MLISPAYAQAAGGPGQDTSSLLIMTVGIIVLMYFMVFRPQQKRAKEHKALMDALQKGDEVVASGGILGKITKVSEGYISVEIAPNTEVQMQKGAVQTLLPKGTIKSI